MVSLVILSIWMKFLLRLMRIALPLLSVVQDGGEIDILVQKRKDKTVAMCFFKHLLKGLGVHR